MALSDKEVELIWILADVVGQNLQEAEFGVYETGFIRCHKEALIALVDAGVMEEVYPEQHYRDSPHRVFYAKFVDNWKHTLFMNRNA